MSAFQKIRQHLTPSGVIALLALVFAIAGTSFAATGGGSGKATASTTFATVAKSKAKPKTKAGPRGPAGPKGATGATGPAGAVGSAGPAGSTGATGAAGSGSAGPQGPQGPQGEKGDQGVPGTPGTNGTTGFTETLPPEKTETGTWAVAASELHERHVHVPISFAIPLPAASSKAFFFDEAETEARHFGSSGCKLGPTNTGTVAEPMAPLGTLCVFAADLETSEASFEGVVPPTGQLVIGYSPTGALLRFAGESREKGSSEEEGAVRGFGTWAVTAPEEA
jgi:hypothetical protein